MVITIWEKWNVKTGAFEHNHIEDGYDLDSLAPQPISDLQIKSWANGIWKKSKGLLIDSVVKQFP